VNNQRSSQESDFKESPRFSNSQPIKQKNNIPMESADLRNLLMNPENPKREVTNSLDPNSARAKVFESQKLEQHILSVEDFKPSSVNQRGNVRESGGNLIKKSIESGIVEQI